MKINKNRFRKLSLLERELGDKLSDKKGVQYVTTYRAVDKSVNDFKDRDYVTLSKKFAVEHAENNHIYNDEQQKVIKAIISTEDLYEANNPGEYFYSGPDVDGKAIYETKGYDYEGWEELTPQDFLSENIEEGPISYVKDKVKFVKDKGVVGTAKHLKDKAVDQAKKVASAAKREKKETMYAAKILLNIIRRKGASDQEVEFLKKQSIDVAKVVGLLGLQAIPLGTTSVAILKKVLNAKGINFQPFPTSNQDVFDEVPEELKELMREMLESVMIERTPLEDDLFHMKRGDFITINRFGKESVVYFSNKKGDSYYAQTWRPGETQTRHDEYFKIYPTNNVEIIKIGNKKVDSKEDIEDEIYFYDQEMRKDAYARDKKYPNIDEMISEKELEKIVREELELFTKKTILESKLKKVNKKLLKLEDFDYARAEREYADMENMKHGKVLSGSGDDSRIEARIFWDGSAVPVTFEYEDMLVKPEAYDEPWEYLYSGELPDGNTYYITAEFFGNPHTHMEFSEIISDYLEDEHGNSMGI